MKYLLPFVCFVLLVAGTVYSVPVEGDACQRQLRCASSPDSTTSGYEPGKSYLYKYDARSVTKQQVAGQEPEEAIMGMSATVRVDINSQSVATLHVVDVEMDQPHVSHDNLEFIKLPVRFSYCNCKVEQICSDKRDPDWSVNMKKGILSSLQFTPLTELASEPVGEETRVLEDTIHGMCETHYQKTGTQNGVYVFNKTINAGSCTDHSRHIQSAIQGDDYPWHKNTSFLDISQQCQVHLTEQKIVSQSVCEDRVSVASMANLPATPEAEVTTRLVYVHTTPLRNVARIDSNGSPQTLKHVHPKPTASYAEERQAREMLKDLAEAEAATEQTAMEFAKLVRIMKGMSYQQLNDLWADAEGLGYRAESILQDAIPLVGTGASIKLVVQLMGEEKYSEPRRDLLYMSMPFIQDPSYDVVEGCEELMELESRGPIYKPLVLGVTSVVHNYCKQNPDCIDDSSIQKILDTLTSVVKQEGGEQCQPETPEAEDKAVLVMKAIGNMGRVTDDLTQTLITCMKNENASHSVRVAAVEAFRRSPCVATQCSHPTPEHEAMMEIMMNQEKDDELKIACFIEVLRCPCDTKMTEIVNLLRNQDVSHVTTFIWSYLTNLQESNSPTKEYARILLDNVDLPKKFSGASLNYARNVEMSSYNYNSGHGITSGSNLIYSHDSFIPRSLMQDLTLDVFGKSVNLIEVGLRNEGFQKILEEILNPANFLSNNPTEKWNFWGRGSDNKQSYEHISQKAQEGILKSLMKSPLVESYVRIFGNEIALMRSEQTEESGQAMIRNAVQNIKNLVLSSIESLKNSKKSWHHSSVLMDSSVSIPTYMGVPVKMSVWATGSVTLEFESKHNSKPMAFLTSFKVKPSGAIVVGHDVGLDSQLFAAGVRSQATISTDTGVEVSLGHVKGRKVAALVNLPKNKMSLINANTQVHSFTRSAERGEQTARRTPDTQESMSRCYEGVSQISGLKLCMRGEMSDSSPESYLPSAANGYRIPSISKGGFSIELVKTDESMSGYMVTGEYNPNKQAVYFKFDTPDSSVDRNIEVEAEFMTEKEYQAAVNIRTPWKQAKIQINYENQPQRKLIKVTLESNYKKWMGLAETSYSVAGNTIQLHPHVSYSVPGMSKPSSMQGPVVVDMEGGTVKMDLKSQDKSIVLAGDVQVQWNYLTQGLAIKMTTVRWPGVFVQGEVSTSYDRRNILQTKVSVNYGEHRERILYHGKLEHSPITNEDTWCLKIASDLRASAYPQYSGTFQCDMGLQNDRWHLRADVKGRKNFTLSTQNHLTLNLGSEIHFEYRGNLHAQPRNVSAEALGSLRLDRSTLAGKAVHDVTVKSNAIVMWHSRADAVFNNKPNPNTKIQALIKTPKAEYVFSQILKKDADGYWRGHGDLVSKPGAQYSVHSKVLLTGKLIEIEATAAHQHQNWKFLGSFKNYYQTPEERGMQRTLLSLEHNGFSVVEFNSEIGEQFDSQKKQYIFHVSLKSKPVTASFATGYAMSDSNNDSYFETATSAGFQYQNMMEVDIPSWNWSSRHGVSVKHAGDNLLSFTVNSQSNSKSNVQIGGVARLPIKDRTFEISGRGHVDGQEIELNAAGKLGDHVFDGKHHFKANVKLPKGYDLVCGWYLITEAEKTDRYASIGLGGEIGINDPLMTLDVTLKIPRKVEYMREPFDALLQVSFQSQYTHRMKLKSQVAYKGDSVDATVHFSSPNLTSELSFSTSRPSKTQWVSQARLIANSNMMSAGATVDSSAPNRKATLRVDVSAPETTWKKAMYTSSTKYHFGDDIVMEHEAKLGYSDKEFLVLQQWEGSRQENEIKGKLVVQTPFADYIHQSVALKMAGGSIMKQKGTITLTVQNMLTNVNVDYDVADRNNISFETDIKTPFLSLPEVKVAFKHQFPSWYEGMTSSLSVQTGESTFIHGTVLVKVTDTELDFKIDTQSNMAKPIALKIHFQKDGPSKYSGHGIAKYGELTAKVEGRVSYISLRHFSIHLSFEVPFTQISVGSVSVRMVPIQNGLAFHFDVDSSAIGKIVHTKITCTKSSGTYDVQVELQWDLRKIITVNMQCSPMDQVYSLTVEKNGESTVLAIHHSGKDANNIKSSLQVFQHFKVVSEKERNQEYHRNKFVASYGPKKVGYEVVMNRQNPVLNIYALERVIQASASWRQSSGRGGTLGDLDVSLALDHSRKPHDMLRVKSSIVVDRRGDQYQVTGALAHPSLSQDVELSGVYKRQQNPFSGFDHYVNLNLANFKMDIKVKADQSQGSGRNQTVSLEVRHEESQLSARMSAHILTEAPFSFGYVGSIRRGSDEKVLYLQTTTKQHQQEPTAFKTDIWYIIPGASSKITLVNGVMKSVEQGTRRFAKVVFGDDRSAKIYAEWQWQKEHPVAPLRSLVVRVGGKDENNKADSVEVSGEWIGNHEIQVSGQLIQGGRRVQLGSVVFSLHTSRALQVTGQWDKEAIKQVYERLSSFAKSVQERCGPAVVQQLMNAKNVYAEAHKMMEKEAGINELVQYYSEETGEMIKEWEAEVESIDVEKIKEQVNALFILRVVEAVASWCKDYFLEQCRMELTQLFEAFEDYIPDWLRPYLGLPKRHHWFTKLVRHVAPAYGSDSSSIDIHPEILEYLLEIIEKLKVMEDAIEEYILSKLRNVPVIVFNLIEIIYRVLREQYPDLVPYFDKLIKYLEQYCSKHVCWPWYRPGPGEIAKFISYYYTGTLDEFDAQEGKLRYSVYLPRPAGSLAGVPASLYRGVFNESWPVLPKLPPLPNFHRRAMVAGGNQWITFDNNLYTFEPKGCEYLLAKDFSPKERFTLKLNAHQMKLVLPPHNIILQNGYSKVLVDGRHVDAHSPHSQLHTQQYDILFESKKVTITSHPPDIKIECFGAENGKQHGYCNVILSDWFQGRSLGLLGTNDGNKNNDFVTPSGQEPSNLWEFVREYKVDPQCDDRDVARRTERVAMTEAAEPNVEINPEEKKRCDLIFSEKTSSLRGCIENISPGVTANYRRMCYQQRYACDVAKIYFSMCIAQGFGPGNHIPDICYRV